jgi:hypothetical protein
MRAWVNKCLSVGVAVVMWLGVLPAPAEAEVLFGITFPAPTETLIRINPGTGAATPVGPLDAPTQFPFGVAARKGELYTFDQQADLIRQLDPATGRTLRSIDVRMGDLLGEGDLTFRRDGIGFLATSPGVLFRFDITNGTSTLITQSLPINIDGLAFDTDNVLFAFSETTATLFTINTGTGVMTTIGPLGVPTGGLGGLSFDATGTLFAAIADNLYTINTATGGATLVGPIRGASEVSGIAFLAVPEPGSLVLLCVGLPALVWLGRKGRDRRSQRSA